MTTDQLEALLVELYPDSDRDWLDHILAYWEDEHCPDLQALLDYAEGESS